MAKKKIQQSVQYTNTNPQRSIFKNIIQKLSKKHADNIKPFLGDDPTSGSIVSDFLSTGNKILDLAMSNRKNGGIPVGRITQISGLQSCVSEETMVKIRYSMNDMVDTNIRIGDLQLILQKGKTVYIKTIDNTYTQILEFLEIGEEDSFGVVLEGGNYIQVTQHHRFSQEQNGWIECGQLIVQQHKLLCEDGKYHVVKDIIPVGKRKIVDVSVQHQNKCYFGNGILNHNTGKSLLCGHLIKSCQQKDGIAIYIDSESSFQPDFLRGIGVDIDKVIHYDITYVQDCYNVIQQLIQEIYKEYPNKLILILIDSLTALQTRSMVQAKANQSKMNQKLQKSRINGQSIPKLVGLIARTKTALVMTTQLRVNMDPLSRQKYVTVSGGMALQFYASVRLKLVKKGKLKIVKRGIQEVIGVNTIAKIDKTRFGPGNRQIQYNIYYDSGMDDYESWVWILTKYKLLIGKGTKNSPFEIVNPTTGEVEITIEGKIKQYLANNPQQRQKIYDIICQVYIMKYKTAEQSRNRETFVDTISKQDENIDIVINTSQDEQED